MDFSGNSNPDLGKMEQIVSQFFLKALHIVLDSRIPSLHTHDHRHGDRLLASQVKKSHKWFNLVLGDRPAALNKLHSWHRSILDSMIIDIILVHPESADSSSSVEESVIERWVVQYETPLVTAPQSGEISTSYQKMYKKSIILLRSLYLQTRLLPAYRVSRQLRSSRYYNVDLVYKVHSFGNPFSNLEEGMMKEYRFVPVEVPPGRLCMSLTYRVDLSCFNLGAFIPLSPKIITDYVGSPNTEPMRFFPTPPDNRVHATSFPVVASQPPLSGPSERPHSWTSGFHKPTTQVMQKQFFGGILPTRPVSSSTYGLYGDNRQISPPFSLPASPSTPSYISRGNNNLLTHGRPGTAPVTIPSHSSNLSDPSKISMPHFSPKSTKRHPASQDSPPGILLPRRAEGFRTGESPSGLINPYSGQKMVKESKDDSGRLSGLLSSSGSPRFGFSRSPSRFSSQDDSDDLDFSCPFDFDDVDGSGPQASLDWRKTLNSTSHSLPVGRKSQDAAVGILVSMLRSAPPLRQDSSSYMAYQSEGGEGFGTASEISVGRKAADALEELRAYKDIKDLLLSKSTTRALHTKETA